MSTAGWFDSHCHLQESFAQAYALDLLREAKDARVDGVICIGTDPTTSRQAIDLSERVEREAGDLSIWATAGLHPHDASMGTALLESLVSSTLDSEKARFLVAIGECGLDYHYDHSPRDEQRTAFAKQIEMARRLDLALVVHCRDAWGDMIDIVSEVGVPQRLVVHCFTGGVKEARRCLDLGAFLSFSGIVTFKNSVDIQQAARVCPLDRLLVETDAPFLAPVPHRGKQNKPAWVPLVGSAIASLKGLSTDEVAASTSKATIEAFALQAESQ